MFCCLDSNPNVLHFYKNITELDPSTALLHSDLQSLWKHSAKLTVMPGPEKKERGKEEEDEEAAGESKQDTEILRTERKRRKSSMREVGLREVTF